MYCQSFSSLAHVISFLCFLWYLCVLLTAHSPCSRITDMESPFLTQEVKWAACYFWKGSPEVLFLMTNVTLLRSLFLSSPSPVPAFLLFLLNVTKPEHEWEEFTRNAASPCGVELRKSVVVISSCGVFVDDHHCPESTQQTAWCVQADGGQRLGKRRGVSCSWPCPGEEGSQGTFPASTVCQGGF